MRNNAGPLILLAMVLALFGGCAWLTRHPDAGIVRRAEGWPFVGGLASSFRQRFTVPPAEAAAEDTGPEVEYVEAIVPPVGEGLLWVIPGTVMRREPREASPKILQFDAIANVVQLEKRGDWYRVWRRGQEGWVYLEGYSAGEPPYGTEPEPPLPLPSTAPPEEALAAARSYLGDGERVLSVGPYKLYTDSADDALLEHLDRVAAQLESAYAERYGRRPVDEQPREAVVLYDDEAAYRQLENRSDRLVGLVARGHTTSGLAFFYVGGRAAWEVAATLIHELVHTLNRRSLGPALPSWLDEGLADDLALSAVGQDGGIVPGSLGGERRRAGDEITMLGGIASLWGLRDDLRAGRLLGVRDLLQLDWQRFVRSDRSDDHYAAAAFWIRFLLDGDEGRLAGPFRDYLHAVSRGEPATPEALRERLDLPWTVLNARYQLWIDFQRPTTRVISGEAGPP